jgi:hypothetical protein
MDAVAGPAMVVVVVAAAVAAAVAAVAAVAAGAAWGGGGGWPRGVRLQMRPAGSVRRNCWFCSEDSDVVVDGAPPGRWTCPRCQSYNGFTAVRAPRPRPRSHPRLSLTVPGTGAQDGDYDRPVGRSARGDADADAPAPAFAERGPWTFPGTPARR